ncbi:hypothetical protein KKG83_03345 [Candidatus Micrarchaeota archaeon]|nr:hypothetical protein [Candidatus Micrarchaeota archaeon]
MKLTYVLILLMLFLYFYSYGPLWIAWVFGLAILLIVVSKLFSGAKTVAVAGRKEFTRDMESDMEKASPKAPNKEFLSEIARETGRKAGEALAPQEYSYKGKGFVGKLGQGAKNFWNGLGNLFLGNAPKHENHSHKHENKHKAEHPVPHDPAPHKKGNGDSHSHH